VQVEVQQATKVQEMVEAHQRGMEMERHELEVVMKKRSTILTKLHLWKKVLKFQTLSNSCGHK